MSLRGRRSPDRSNLPLVKIASGESKNASQTATQCIDIIMMKSPSLQIGSFTFNWGSRTYVMGILNVTPDSFSGDGIIAKGDVVDVPLSSRRGIFSPLVRIFWMWAANRPDLALHLSMRMKKWNA